MDQNFTRYRRDVTEQATSSLHRLSRSLEREPAVPLGPRQRAHSPGSPPRSGGRRSRSPYAWNREENEDYTYATATHRLRASLKQYEDEREHQHESRLYLSPRSRSVPANRVYAPPPAPTLHVPSPSETVPLLNNQNALIAQLQAQKNYAQEELQVLKLKTSELAEENRLLHEELKRSVIQEIVNEGLDVPGIPLSFPFTNSVTTKTTMHSVKVAGEDSDPARPMARQDYGRWQRELERITALHTAKASRLETQLSHTREELEKSEQAVSALEGQLRMLQSVRDAGGEEGFSICIRL